jgi:hypothetical protein
MDTHSNGDSPQLDEPATIGGPALDSEAAKQFDTFETRFFERGDETNVGDGEDHYDDFPGAKDKRHLVSYRSLAGVSIASSVLAVAASLALFQSNAPAAGPTGAMAASAKPAPTSSTSVPRAQMAKNSATALVPQAAAITTAVVLSSNASAAAATATRVAPTAPGLPAAEPVAPAVPPAHDPAPELAEAPAPEEDAKVDEAKVGKPRAAASTPDHDDDPGQRCRESVRDKRPKAIVAACTAAFAADATDAEAAIAVAKVEVERGRFAQAYAWSKKAIAVNPESAEAYVFAGSAEQNRGHGKAAKEAYLHYLRLAPSGRYAAEIRTIVNSL